MDSWRTALLDARRDAGVGRRKLAELAGVSIETIRGYEIGRRHPRQETLETILTALGLDRGRANAIREAAGFAPVRTGFGGSPTYYYSLDELAVLVERATWPQFAVDDLFNIVAANKAVCALWGIRSLAAERGRRGTKSMAMFDFLERRDLIRRLVNWDDIVEIVASYLKGRPALAKGEAADELFREMLLEPFQAREPRFLERMHAAWDRAQPRSPRVRWDYEVTWSAVRGSTIRFHGFVSPANEREGLVFNDWIPVDAESWRRFQTAVTPKT